jgi:hypothetical protein
MRLVLAALAVLALSGCYVTPEVKSALDDLHGAISDLRAKTGNSNTTVKEIEASERRIVEAVGQVEAAQPKALDIFLYVLGGIFTAAFGKGIGLPMLSAAGQTVAKKLNGGGS